MNAFTITLAGVTGEIMSEYRLSPAMYAAFRSEGEPRFQITLTDDDIDFTDALRGGKTAGVRAPLMLRKAADALLPFDVLLMHGAVVAIEGGAYMFTAVSGTGKTTQIESWLERLPEAYVVNGDKPFIRFSDDAPPMACGSPWAGKEQMYTNTMVPLRAIALLERAEDNSIERISFAEAFPTLLQQTYRPKEPERMRQTLNLMQRLNPAVSFWRFHCNNFKEDSFDVAYRALVEGRT